MGVGDFSDASDERPAPLAAPCFRYAMMESPGERVRAVASMFRSTASMTASTETGCRRIRAADAGRQVHREDVERAFAPGGDGPPDVACAPKPMNEDDRLTGFAVMDV